MLCFLNGKHPAMSRTQKTFGKSSFSQLTGIWSDDWSWLRHHAPSPDGLGRSSAKHLGMAFQKKKRSHSNRKSSRWGLFILGIVVPNQEYPKGLSYRKWIVTRKNGWLVDMIGPSSWDPSICGMDIHLKWLRTWCSICHRTEKHPGHVLWPGPNHHFNPTVDNHISLVQSRDI